MKKINNCDQVNNTNLSQKEEKIELIEKSEIGIETKSFQELLRIEKEKLDEFELLVDEYNELISEFDNLNEILDDSIEELSEEIRLELQSELENMDETIFEMESDFESYEYPEYFYEDILWLSDEDKENFCVERVKLLMN